MWFFLLALVSSPLVCSGNWNDLPCECGHELMNRRIVNGTEVDKHKYPWMAAMKHRDDFMCGGAVISNNNILTAGHCVHDTEDMNIYWILGVHNLTVDTRNMHYIYFTANFLMHPKFSYGRMYDNYDMAIVITERSIQFDDFVMPICLPVVNEDQLYIHHDVTVSGWGRLRENGEFPDVLLETNVTLLTIDECSSRAKNLVFDPHSMLCAHKKYTDACQGDSGSPFFIKRSSSVHVLLGAVSFGRGCATQYPGIYAKVPDPYTLAWIYSVIQNSRARMCSNPGL